MLRTAFALTTFLLLARPALAQTDFSQVRFRFLGKGEAGAYLSAPDDFLRHLTPITLSLLYQTPATIPLEEHARFLARQALDWAPEEISRLEGEIAQLEAAVNALDLSLPVPPEVLLVKTTGEDEFHAHYTRGNAIVFPVESAEKGVTTDSPTLFHEFFHIVSRFRASLPGAATFHDRLYALCGYHRVAEPALPSSLAGLALTNPDAFRYEHAIEVTVHGLSRTVIPFFHSAIPQENVRAPVDESKAFKLGLLDLATLDAPAPALFATAESDYLARTRANSRYTIHPEEIMAENFRLLLMRAAGIVFPAPLPHPEALDELRGELAASPSVATTRPSSAGSPRPAR